MSGMSSSDTNCDSSSSSDMASSSSSDAGPDINNGHTSPIASGHLWTSQASWPSQASREPPVIMHTPSWTPTLMVNGHSRVRPLIGSDNSPTDVCDLDQHFTESRHFNGSTGRCTNSYVTSRAPPCHPLIDRLLHDNWRSPRPLPNRLLQDISDIQAIVSCPPMWDRFLLDHVISESNYRSPTFSDEVAQDREILSDTEDEGKLDFAITESNDRSLIVLNEIVQDGAIQNDTEDEGNLHSRALTSRPSMDSQFATLIEIVRRPPLRHPELAPSDAVSTTSSRRSLNPDSSAVRVTSTMHSSGSYFHPCMTGPIVDRPMSHQDWHNEERDWLGEESSVSSSYTNGSSKTSTSVTACISSSSFDLSPDEHDRSLTVTAMSPLRRSLSLTRLMEICPLPTSFDVDSEAMNMTTYFF